MRHAFNAGGAQEKYAASTQRVPGGAFNAPYQSAASLIQPVPDRSVHYAIILIDAMRSAARDARDAREKRKSAKDAYAKRRATRGAIKMSRHAAPSDAYARLREVRRKPAKHPDAPSFSHIAISPDDAAFTEAADRAA